jgi:hypothetical protein
MAAKLPASIIYENMYTSIYEKINNINNNNLYENLEIDEIDTDDEIDDTTLNETEEVLYYNASNLFYGKIENKVETLKNLILEIDRLSWELFDDNKTYGANSIDIFSPKIARIFDMSNTITDNIKFKSKRKYSDKNSYFIGDLNEKYKVFMPKEITRIVLSEKISSNYVQPEKFIEEKCNTIEIYNSEIPNKRFKIILENL